MKTNRQTKQNPSRIRINRTPRNTVFLEWLREKINPI